MSTQDAINRTRMIYAALQRERCPKRRLELHNELKALEQKQPNVERVK